MKTYNSPMLQVVSINKNDVIATSETMSYGLHNYDGSSTILAPGQRGLNDWDAGY